MSEHLRKNGKYEIFVNKNNIKNNDTNVLLAKIQSRHIKKMEYKIVIEYVPEKNDVSSILAWTCTCKNGKRDVGTCSHVACIILYLAFGKYQENLLNPGYSLNNILIKIGTSDIEESEDNEDDEFEKNLEENLEENRIKMSRELSNLSIEGDCKKQKTDVVSVLNFSSILPTWGGNIVLNSDD